VGFGLLAVNGMVETPQVRKGGGDFAVVSEVMAGTGCVLRIDPIWDRGEGARGREPGLV
jgi:hypothetical protein